MRRIITFLRAGAVGAAVLCSVAHAQPTNNDASRPLTRAQVKADLVEWRNAGYNPQSWVADPDYFATIAQRVTENRHGRTVAQ